VLGLGGDWTPRHAKRYAELGAAMEAALKAYAEDVQSGAFPTDANSSKIPEAELAQALSAKV
ncbi:MAG: 3-methyl-2-oxobutanoate hydroxymethyltransferase, partial [Caulobacteraceae bacterium]